MARSDQDQDAIALLQKLVSIPSLSRQEHEASTALVAWMNDQGLSAHVDAAGNAVGVKGEGDKELLFLGHIDTFPGEVPVRQEGDILYGRGSVDAKGPLCTFANAAARVTPPEGWRLRVVGAVEEESATSKGARYIAHSSTQAPQAIVIGEPSRWDRITLGYKGRLLLELSLTFPFAHSAGQEELPAERAVSLWQGLVSYCDQHNETQEASRPFDQLSPSLRQIQSNDRGAFGDVTITLGFRLPPGLDPMETQAKIWSLLHMQLYGESLAAPEAEPPTPSAQPPAALVGKVNPALLQPPTTTYQQDAQDISIKAVFSGGEQAHKSNKSNPLVRSFLRSIREHEAKPRFVVKTGTCDMNVLTHTWPDVPMVAYGPGDSALDHTPHEHIDLNEYLRAIDVLTGMCSHIWGNPTE